MTEQILKTRIVHKHDIESNWKRAVNFIPKLGELIVYDIDTNYDYERFKIGDGKTLVSELPFYLEDEIDAILEKMKYLADNMLDAEYQNGMLVFTKGISFPNTIN